MNVQIILILLVTKVDSKLIVRERVSGDLHFAVDNIIKQFLVGKFSVVNIIRATENEFEAGDFESKLITMNRDEFLVRLDSYKSIQNIQNRKKKNNLILLDDIESFRLFIEKMSSNVFSFSDFFLVVLLDGKIKEIGEIFDRCWEKNIYNVNVIYETKFGAEVTTFMPFEDEKKWFFRKHQHNIPDKVH
jgi:hypothetical protein